MLFNYITFVNPLPLFCISNENDFNSDYYV